MIAVLIPGLGVHTPAHDIAVAQARIAAKSVDWPNTTTETVRIEHTTRPAIDPDSDDLASHVRMMRTTTDQRTMLAVWPWWAVAPHRRIIGLGAHLVAKSKRPSVWPHNLTTSDSVLILNRGAYDALYDALYDHDQPHARWWTPWHTNPDPWNRYAVRLGAPTP